VPFLARFRNGCPTNEDSRSRPVTHFTRIGRRDFEADLHVQHRRERRDTDGERNGRLHLLARVPRGRPQSLRQGGHHPQGRRPSDDLRRLRASADLRPRRLGFVPRGEAGASSPRSATPPSAGICRSKPMAAAFPTCIRHGPLQTSGPGSRRRCNRCTRRCTSALLASACWRCPEPRRQRCRARPRR
jgi:hypothetical protein